MANQLRICDACGESYKEDFLHYCSCGALLCTNCYTEDNHIEHDTEPPAIRAIPPHSDAKRAAKLSQRT